MAFGSDSELLQKDDYLENLAFYYYDEYDSSKFEYYKKYSQSDSSEITDLEELTIPVESPQTSVSSSPMDRPWSMKCHDIHHTSRSPHSTAHIDGLEKWRFRCDGVDGSSVIGGDGTIYFGDKDRDIYAIYPNGTLKWKYQTSGWITSAPALAEDGTLYVGSWDCKLYAFNSTTGAKKWSFDSGASISSSPAIAGDGVIYFGNMLSKNTIFAVNPNGTEEWRYATDYAITCDPAIGDDGTIYIGSGDDYLYAMNPNGTLKWRFKTGDINKGPASIAEDGTVYIGSFDDYLYALFPTNGSMKWKCKVGHGTYTNPSIANDGTIYIGGQKLYAIYPNGTMRWSFDLGSESHIAKSSPAISADGTIYVGTNIDSVDGGDIIAVNPDGTEKWRKRISYEWVDSSPCIGQDGTVYIGSQNDIARGYIHAFGPVESNNPPETPTISGEINGNVRENYEYKLRVIDPDNNPISFYIDWGDGTHTGWTSERASGENCYYGHTWPIRGNYTIRAKAKDVLGEESDWAYLEVTMPKNQQTTNNVILRYLENHPRIFPLIRQILELN
jgi:outer membrane protein assembly factor BamB